MLDIRSLSCILSKKNAQLGNQLLCCLSVILFILRINFLPPPAHPSTRYLDLWVHHKTARCYVSVRPSGQIVGYTVLRPADVGWKMYPLYADDKNIAHALFCKAASDIPRGEDLIFTQPIENENANEFVKACGLTQYLSMTRLYNKCDVHVDISRVYSVSSTEYGIV